MRLLTAVVAVTVCLGIGGGESLARSKSSRSQRHHKRNQGEKDEKEQQASGRRHLKKANALAGEGDCARAIAEYTVAYEKLDDSLFDTK